MLRQLKKRQQGFTLIEIIAVLIVLAILAAVAIPRYMDTVSQARDKSAEQAVAEGMARLDAITARLMLTNADGLVPAASAIKGAVVTADTDAGDYTLTFTEPGVLTGSDIDVKAVGKSGTPADGGTKERAWRRPTSG